MSSRGEAAKNKRSQPSPPIEQTLFRLRVRYVKQGRLAYLGHLEVIHTIERCIRRAGLPYAVTQGFSPHMRVGYTSALPVGTSSVCEWFDVFLTELIPADVCLSRLRGATPADLSPQEAGFVDVRAASLASEINRIGYVAVLEGAPSRQELQGAMRRVCERAQIPYERSGKQKVLDLDKTLAGWELVDGRLVLHTRCDNEGSLRPEIVLAALDRELSGSTEPIVSTGTQELRVMGSCRVERLYQRIVSEDGRPREPLQL